MNQTIITTENAPAVVGPYSQAVVHNGLVYTSGQIAIDPKTKSLVAGGIVEQTEQVIKNLKAVLQAAGSSFDDILKATVYLSDMENYAAMNEIYGQHFTSRPARSALEVARLPLDVLIEIDIIAISN